MAQFCVEQLIAMKTFHYSYVMRTALVPKHANESFSAPGMLTLVLCFGICLYVLINCKETSLFKSSAFSGKLDTVVIRTGC